MTNKETPHFSDESSDASFKWFGVRSIYEWTEHRIGELRCYEERIVSVRADSLDSAIEAAEVEATEYCENLELGFVHLGLYQGYQMAGEYGDYSGPLTPSVELFSQLRKSTLEPEDYLNQFFDTGTENTSENF